MSLDGWWVRVCIKPRPHGSPLASGLTAHNMRGERERGRMRDLVITQPEPGGLSSSSSSSQLWFNLRLLNLI